MKLSSYVMIILGIGLTFAIVGSVVSDFETNYPEKSIDTSWENKYDYQVRINNSVSIIKEKFDIIRNEEKGWFSKITAGITAVPLAIIFVPRVIFTTTSYGIEIFSNLSSEVGVPIFVQVFGITAFVVLVVFGLVQFWHRSKI